jgi:hypothetical protein
MQNGGKRQGAGRPKGAVSGHTKEVLIFKEELIRRVLAEKGPIIEALIKKVKTGDVQALREINDRLLGKPHQQLWLDDETISALTLRWEGKK